LDRLVIVTLSVAAHVAILLALFSVRSDPPRALALEPAPIPVALVELPPPTPPKPPEPPSPAPPSPEKPPPKLHKPPPQPVPPDIEPLPARPDPKATTGVELTAAQLAGAASAGSGSGGGGVCDVARWLEAGLRKDPRVQAALINGSLGPGSGNRALMLWNGDWVRSEGEDGGGLAVIREAVMMEILSAPAACRTQPMHGLVLISPIEGAGSARLAVGSGDWRWADLLLPRGGVTGHPVLVR
jgi:hypothetical protein